MLIHYFYSLVILSFILIWVDSWDDSHVSSFDEVDDFSILFSPDYDAHSFSVACKVNDFQDLVDLLISLQIYFDGVGWSLDEAWEPNVSAHF